MSYFSLKREDRTDCYDHVNNRIRSRDITLPLNKLIKEESEKAGVVLRMQMIVDRFQFIKLSTLTIHTSCVVPSTSSGIALLRLLRVPPLHFLSCI